MTFIRAILCSAPLVLLLAAGCGEAPGGADALVDSSAAALSAPEQSDVVDVVAADTSRAAHAALVGDAPAAEDPALFGEAMAALSSAAQGPSAATEASADRDEDGWRALVAEHP